MTIPTISSIGTPPERHAGRVIAEMCRWLVGETERLNDLWHKEVYSTSHSSLGSIKAQKRFHDRVLKHGNKAILEFGIETGKRAKFTMRWVTWDVVAPITGRYLLEGEPIPERPWLACTLTYTYGPGHRIKREDRAKEYRTFVLTHHAMQRLAERCSVRTPDDLLAALRDIWQQLESAIRKDAVPERDMIAWQLPLPTIGGVAVIERNPKLSFVVKTILEPGMRG